jgi:hypothetical protein
LISTAARNFLLRLLPVHRPETPWSGSLKRDRGHFLAVSPSPSPPVPSTMGKLRPTAGIDRVPLRSPSVGQSGWSPCPRLPGPDLHRLAAALHGQFALGLMGATITRAGPLHGQFDVAILASAHEHVPVFYVHDPTPLCPRQVNEECTRNRTLASVVAWARARLLRPRATTHGS